MPIDAVNGVTTNAMTNAATSVSGTTSDGGDGFAASLGSAVDGLQQLQSDSKTLALKAVTGNLDDIHDATIASTRAQVTLELVAAVRNKGVDAFNEIMRMQA
ncbi:flagellar hook-basal body complex protein FliE [Curtobacterium sp. MCJR17_055]|jgi:flagellar hook-basal body complex protein FliE|uniref:flagellar hook-basal body complex protein FliE n=1 Tax=unclassified Curtobacterium TaxID=257496 RepID=UPI000D88019C|nr:MULTISPECIES: flagellar hook-basal body complex protein FliE [unclassified Curtobacterium]PYY33124.1 flagellar hook-basal body complex protein FliE [Curtobacterium sp. MCBD17_029]PYY50922.1 flagellar hook-basal body complex protein FliE [Curtobacterium sp. MCBD17_023]PYY53819.1 flagellar hook-basal body complex protein FliE [Curtobacterium sp. MCJR17_055]PYY59292.1 flagellar hook-basal body complex protein FliE [Curtobacterium sp. MCPF17_015]PZE92768.1 flagellar hook-basal body complex prot